MTTASGQAIRVENDDVVHPEKLYAEVAYAEMYAPATPVVITMASTAAIKVLGNTQADSGALVASVTAVGVTADIAAGTFTVTRGGVYELYLAGQVTGIEDQDVLLEWRKNSTNLGEPHECLVQLDATTVSALIQLVSARSLVTLVAGDVVSLGVLGSNDEQVDFGRFNFGIRLVKSASY